MHNRVKMLMVAILILTLKMVASQIIVDNSLGEGEVIDNIAPVYSLIPLLSEHSY